MGDVDWINLDTEMPPEGLYVLCYQKDAGPIWAARHKTEDEYQKTYWIHGELEPTLNTDDFPIIAWAYINLPEYR